VSNETANQSPLKCQIQCKVKSIDSLSDCIYRIRLVADGADQFEFVAGQYLMLLMPSGDLIPLSIASPPQQAEFIELHLRLMPAPSLSADMLQLFKTAAKVTIQGPFGGCFLRHPEKDNVFIAGGTGYSPMKSMLESAFTHGMTGKIHLFLGAQQVCDLYHHQYLLDWQQKQPNFSYTPVIAEHTEDWQGDRGFPHWIAIEQYLEEIQSKDFYIAGSEAMVMAVYQELLDKGVNKSQIYSDILDIKRENGELG